MRSKPLATITILFLFTIIGCTGFRYQPVGFRGGYSESLVDNNTMVVRYDAPSVPFEVPAVFSTEQHIQFFLMYRCADLTVLNGHDYFVVIDSTVPITIVSSDPQLQHYQVISVVDLGSVLGAVGRGLPPSRDSEPSVTSVTDVQEATIQMFDGPKSETRPFSYDAKELLKTLPLRDEALAKALSDRKR